MGDMIAIHWRIMSRENRLYAPFESRRCTGIATGTRLKWRYLRLLQQGKAFEIYFNHA